MKASRIPKILRLNKFTIMAVKRALIIASVTLLAACSSGGSDGSSDNSKGPNNNATKVRAIANLDDYSQFESTITVTASSCYPEHIGETAEYDLRINNELDNIRVITATRSGPNDTVLEGIRFGNSSLVLTGDLSVYAHRVHADEIEILFQGADLENGTFTHLSATFDWTFTFGNTPCTGSSTINGVMFDALNYFQNPPTTPVDGQAQWTLGADNFSGDALTYWGQIYNGNRLLQIGSAQVDSAQFRSTSLTMAIPNYDGPGTYPISADDYNTVYVLQFNNNTHNNCIAGHKSANSSGSITLQLQNGKVVGEYTATMNCYSDANFEVFTHSAASTGSFTIDEDT